MNLFVESGIAATASFLNNKIAFRSIKMKSLIEILLFTTSFTGLLADLFILKISFHSSSHFLDQFLGLTLVLMIVPLCDWMLVVFKMIR